MTSRGYIILNTIRAISIFSLCMAIVASITTLVKSFILFKYFLFDVLNNLILALFCLLLLFSEISLFSTYYERRWPLFGPQSSLVSIGVAEVVVGFQLLGMINDYTASKETIIVSFNALLMAAGVVVSATGVVVFISSYVYSNSMTHTTARTVRSRAHNTFQRETPKPILALERVITEPTNIEHPQRSYSQSSRALSSSHGLERPPSAALWVPVRLGGIEGSNSTASSVSGRGPHAYATAGVSRTPKAEVYDISYLGSSEAGASSFYSSKPSPSEYSVKGNPYARID